MTTPDSNTFSHIAPHQYNTAVIGALTVVQSLFTGEVKLTAVSLSEFALLTELVVLHDRVCSVDLYGRPPHEQYLQAFNVSANIGLAFGIQPTVSLLDVTGEIIHVPLLIAEPEGPPLQIPSELKEPLLNFYNFDLRTAMRGAGFTDILQFLEHVHFEAAGDQYRTLLDITKDGMSALIAVAPHFGQQTALTALGLLPKLQLQEVMNRSLGHELYAAIANQYKISADRLARYDKAYRIPVPPLLAILLQRCKSREDIPQQLYRLRDEFKDLRSEVAELEKDVRSRKRFKEQIEAIEEIERVREALTARITGRKSLTRSFVKRMFGGLDEMGVFKAFKKDFTTLLRWDEERILVNRVHRFVDLWRLSVDVEKHYPLLQKVFGAESIDQNSFARLQKALPPESFN